MNLPFLQQKKMVSSIMANRKPDGTLEVQNEAQEMHPGLLSAAEDLISAVHSKDSQAVASALKAAMQMGESE